MERHEPELTIDLTADLPEHVLALLGAAGSFDGGDHLDPAQLTALLSALDEPTRARVLSRFGVKIAAVTAVASLGGTAALAATGSLPDPAQNGVSRAMEKVGVSVPRAQVAEVDDVDDEDDGEHGARVSEVARDPELTGAEKGAAVSSVARQQGEDKRAARGEDDVDDVEESDEVEATDELDDADERPDNHGARVSAVANDPELTGAEKGAAVSAVARQQGEEQRAARGNGDDGDDDDGDKPAGVDRPKGPPADSPGATAPGRGGRGG